MKSVRTIGALAAAGLFSLVLVSCARPAIEDVLLEDEASQLQIRSLQSRVFDTSDRIRTMRAVIATLQDLDFVIDQADSRLGVITATRMSGYLLSTTVMVTERDAGRLLVRARMHTGWQPLAGQESRALIMSSPVPDQAYQEFFHSLETNMSLVSRWLPLPKGSVPD